MRAEIDVYLVMLAILTDLLTPALSMKQGAILTSPISITPRPLLLLARDCKSLSRRLVNCLPHQRSEVQCF